MRKSAPALTVPFKQADYDSLRLKMDRFPQKLKNARDKYLRTIIEAGQLDFLGELTELDRQVIKLNQEEKLKDSI